MDGCQQQQQHKSHRPSKLNGGGSWRVMLMAEQAATILHLHRRISTSGRRRNSGLILYQQLEVLLLIAVVLDLQNIDLKSKV